MSLTPNESSLPRAITVRTTAANMTARVGPAVPHYNMPLDRGRVFRFVEASVLTADDITVITTNGQGTQGRWLLVREPTKGVDLTDTASQSITVSGDFYRRFPTVSQTSTVTLDTTNAEAGDVITITRTDTSAFTVAVINGGPGAGTLVTFLVSVQAFGDFYFDGTNWEKQRAATMLA